MEDDLCNTFLSYLLDLFKGATFQIPGRPVTGMPVK